MKRTLQFLVVFNLMLGLATAYGFHLIMEQRHDGCEARNDATRNGALVVTESLVKAATPGETDQARIDSFLDDVDSRLEKVMVKC